MIAEIHIDHFVPLSSSTVSFGSRLEPLQPQRMRQVWHCGVYIHAIVVVFLLILSRLIYRNIVIIFFFFVLLNKIDFRTYRKCTSYVSRLACIIIKVSAIKFDWIDHL